MSQFKKMKMRINNPDHSKAVQEWLFEQGYEWFNRGKTVLYTDRPYLYTTGDGELRCGSGGNWTEESFVSDCREEVDVQQHLDPHLFAVNKSNCVPAKFYHKKSSPKSELEKLSTQLKQLDKAIDSHENKQNKRKKDRERVIQKMEGMLPEGYGICLTGGESGYSDIVVGSVWECVSKEPDPYAFQDCSVGKRYKITKTEGDYFIILDDVEEDVTVSGREDSFTKAFKRVS